MVLVVSPIKAKYSNFAKTTCELRLFIPTTGWAGPVTSSVLLNSSSSISQVSLYLHIEVL